MAVLLDRVLLVIDSIDKNEPMDTVFAMKEKKCPFPYNAIGYQCYHWDLLQHLTPDVISSMTNGYCPFEIAPNDFSKWATDFSANILQVTFDIFEYDDLNNGFVDFGCKKYIFKEWLEGTVWLFILDYRRCTVQYMVFYPLVFPKSGKSMVEKAVAKLNDKYEGSVHFEYRANQECVYCVDDIRYMEPSEENIYKIIQTHESISSEVINVLSSYGFRYPIPQYVDYHDMYTKTEEDLVNCCVKDSWQMYLEMNYSPYDSVNRIEILQNWGYLKQDILDYVKDMPETSENKGLKKLSKEYSSIREPENNKRLLDLTVEIVTEFMRLSGYIKKDLFSPYYPIQ